MHYSVWSYTTASFFTFDRAFHFFSQMLGIRLKLHVSNNPFTKNNSLPPSHPFEKLKNRIYLRNTRESVGEELVNMLQVAGPSASQSGNANGPPDGNSNSTDHSILSDTVGTQGSSEGSSLADVIDSGSSGTGLYDETVIRLDFSKVERGKQHLPYAASCECSTINQLPPPPSPVFF